MCARRYRNGGTSHRALHIAVLILKSLSASTMHCVDVMLISGETSNTFVTAMA
jgi:hypothetical protein